MTKKRTKSSRKFNRIIASVLVLCLAAVLLPIYSADAASSAVYENLTVESGFNADVVATSTSSSSSEHHSNTDTLDNAGKASKGACFYSKNVFSNSGYLPENNIVASTSSSTSGLTWKLASYTSNNALKLYADQPDGKLTFSKYGCYQKVYILCVAGGLGAGRSANMDTTIAYTDGTTSTSLFSVYDWYDSNNAATGAFQRIDGGRQDGSASGAPYMTQCVMNVDTTKLIKEIRFKSSTKGMFLGILAVTGVTANIDTPVATAATKIATTSLTANWNAVADATGYVLDVSKDSNFSTTITGYNNVDVKNVTSYALSGLDKNTTYYYRVRAYSSDGYSASSNVISAKTTDAENCIVTFMKDGTVVDKKTVVKNSALTDIPKVPDKVGYNGVWNVTDFSNITTDMTVNAVYTAKSYVLTFMADGKKIAEKTYTYGNAFTDIPEIPTKVGFDKIKPYWDNNFSSITDDTTVTAVYTKNPYTVTFMVDGKEYTKKSVDSGDTLTDIPAVPTKTGQNGVWDTKVFTNITKDMTVNAVYTAATYTLVFVADGETVAEKLYTYGTEFTDIPTIPAKVGYTNTNPIWDNDFTNITANTTVNAIYTANTYKVTFIADGVTVAEKSVAYGDTLTDIPNVPEKTGYTNTAPKWNTSDFADIKENMTVTAVYVINTYKVTMPKGSGYTATAKSELTSVHGNPFIFTVDIGKGYTKSADFSVKANGATLVPNATGEYIIDKVLADTAITVSGVVDSTKPEAVIIVAENSWNTLNDAVLFDTFFNTAQNVSVSATDAGSGVKSLEYLVSEVVLSEDEMIASAEWKAYTEQFELAPNANYVVYVRATDNSGNIAYICSSGLVFDDVVPQVKGLENKKTYTGKQTFSIEGLDIISVTVNGKNIEVKNNQFALSPAKEDQVVVITDSAGNTTTYTIKVNEAPKSTKTQAKTVTNSSSVQTGSFDLLIYILFAVIIAGSAAVIIIRDKKKNRSRR